MSLHSAGVFVLSLRFPRLCVSLRVCARLCMSLRVFVCLCVSLRSLGVFVVFRWTAHHEWEIRTGQPSKDIGNS